MATHTPAEVFPPGDFIKEELEARGWTQGDLAAVIGRPMQAVSEIIAGKRAVTADTAQALGEAFGTGAQIWMNLESAWRLSQSKADTGGIARRSQLYSKAPVKEIVRRGWIEATDDLDELEGRILKFMGMTSLDDAPEFAAAAHKSTSYSETAPSQVAWLRRARQLAMSVDSKAFQKKRFEQHVRDIRDLAVSEADVRRIPRFLAELGVRLVLVEHLDGTKMDGAAFWIDESPVIALSIRFDRIDNLWFVIGHEVAHILNGDGRVFYDEKLVGEDAERGSEKPECERAADQFASELLIPSGELDDFISRIRPLYSRNRIVGFANRIGVHPGIVVGQLQFRGEIGYWHSRALLMKVRNEIAESAMTDGWGHNPGIC